MRRIVEKRCTDLNSFSNAKRCSLDDDFLTEGHRQEMVDGEVDSCHSCPVGVHLGAHTGQRLRQKGRDAAMEDSKGLHPNRKQSMH